MLRREYFSLYLDVLMCFDVANINFFVLKACTLYVATVRPMIRSNRNTSDDKVQSVPIGRPALASQLL